jgi:muramoyltetrapeptide carboxypeptidase
LAPLVIPPPLRPGATVRVIAPASPFDRTLALCGIAFLGERYRVQFDWSMFERDGFLAGSDERVASSSSAPWRRPKFPP